MHALGNGRFDCDCGSRFEVDVFETRPDPSTGWPGSLDIEPVSGIEECTTIGHGGPCWVCLACGRHHDELRLITTDQRANDEWRAEEKS